MTERKLGLHSLDYPCLRLVKAKHLLLSALVLVLVLGDDLTLNINIVNVLILT